MEQYSVEIHMFNDSYYGRSGCR